MSYSNLGYFCSFWHFPLISVCSFLLCTCCNGETPPRNCPLILFSRVSSALEKKKRCLLRCGVEISGTSHLEGQDTLFKPNQTLIQS
ncbi:hypothetical protein RHMOL_Rhmol07G0030500 [Rhododendron molle]|uniref:Uncharacterized protein n=1 Tax=Rhododendron molle TaxID=49168 RepID=A0ACC0MYE8_RHOML|nr:hypothetical protein RHMOL_Rhmol07G0030500 [Rhododendron molle]